MPPFAYRLMHRDARLADAERERLLWGLVLTLGKAEREGARKRRTDRAGKGEPSRRHATM